MDATGFDTSTRTQRPKRGNSKTTQLMHRPRLTPKARNKVYPLKQKAVTSLSGKTGTLRDGVGAYCVAELRDIGKKVEDIEKNQSNQHGEIAELKERLDAIEQAMEGVENRLWRLENPPAPVAATRGVRGHLIFGTDEDTRPIPPASPKTPAPTTPMADVMLRPVSAEREEEFFMTSLKGERYRPEIYASNLFMALTPFDEYKRWARKVNWSGTNGKLSLPENLKRSVHTHTTQRFPGMSEDQWQRVRNRINDMLRNPRKADPEQPRLGFA